MGEGRKEKARAKGVKRGERRMKRFDRLWSWLIRHIPRWWPCWRRSVWVCQHFHGATHGSVKAGWNRQQWSRPGYTVLLTVHVKMANACTLKPLLKWLQNMQMWMWIFFFVLFLTPKQFYKVMRVTISKKIKLLTSWQFRPLVIFCLSKSGQGAFPVRFGLISPCPPFFKT